MTMKKIDRRTFIAAAPALACVPAISASAAPAEDPMCALVADWFKWRKIQVDLSHRPDGGNFDLPEQLEAEARYDALAEKIANGKATSAAGVAAQLEWLDEDSAGLQCLCELNTTALHNAIDALRGGLV